MRGVSSSRLATRMCECMLCEQAASMRKERAKSLIVLSENAMPASTICGGDVFCWLILLGGLSSLSKRRLLSSTLVTVPADFLRGGGGK